MLLSFVMLRVAYLRQIGLYKELKFLCSLSRGGTLLNRHNMGEKTDKN